jgi:Dyp-type peroxidase family
VEATGTGQAPNLANIQGNVFGGFNKPHQAMLYLKFADAESGKAFIDAVIDLITDSQVVFDWKKTYEDSFPKDLTTGRRPDPSGELEVGWTNLVLSAAGLEAIGAPGTEGLAGEFREGMAAAKGRIGDDEESDPSRWIAPFGAPAELHAMAIVGADSEALRDKHLGEVREAMTAHGVVELGEQLGDLLPEPEAGHEHFGFKDGVSQPRVTGVEPPEGTEEQVAPDQFALLDAAAPETPPPPPGSGEYPTPPTPPGPPAIPPWAREGSYLVYRRLRQNVAGFDAFVAEQAAALGVTPEELGALLVGRYKSGAPVELTHKEAEENPAGVPKDEEARLGEAVINDFDFAPQDEDGHLVPQAAHIRKAYPRNQKEPGEDEAERHRILRRGIPYGKPLEPGEPPYGGGGGTPADDGHDRGLLFLCYQASIAEGFEFIQRNWVNNPTFPTVEGGAEAGRDAIISQDSAEPKFHIPAKSTTLTLARWVFTTGGEYFFSPSLSGLRELAG